MINDVEKNGKRSFSLWCWKYKFYDADDSIDRSEVFIKYWVNIILRDKFGICEIYIWADMPSAQEHPRTLISCDYLQNQTPIFAKWRLIVIQDSFVQYRHMKLFVSIFFSFWGKPDEAHLGTSHLSSNLIYEIMVNAIFPTNSIQIWNYTIFN